MTNPKNILLNSFFPPICFGCGSFGIELCERCLLDFDPVTVFRCLACEGEIPPSNNTCSCRGNPMLGVVYPIWKYKGAVKKTIINLKYGSHQEALKPLITFMRPSQLSKIITLTSKVPNPLLVPVPTHSSKLRSRGFNQAELFARALGKILGAELIGEDVIVKKKQSKAQASLKRRQDRIINATGTFYIVDKKPLIGRNIVIIDDVLTTGATICEIAKLLHPHTALRANSVVLAHEEGAL